MYHCNVNFYLINCTDETAEIIKNILPPDNFSYIFYNSIRPDTEFMEKADIVFIAADNAEYLQPVISAKRRTILLTDKENFSEFSGFLSDIDDIWFTPITEAEIRFRFAKLQNEYVSEKERWQTEQYLETTINSIPSLIWYKDKNGIHRKVNDSFCRTVNKTRQQIEGRKHSYIWNAPEDEGNDCMKSDMEVMMQKKTIAAEEYVKSGDDMKLLKTFKSPLYDIDGSVMGTVGVGIDITKERKYEQEIIRKNLMMETIFSAVDCGILCHSLDGTKVLSVNKMALKILGYNSVDELTCSGFDMIADSVLDEDKPMLRKAIKTLKNVGESVSTEYRVKHDDGSILHIMGNVKLLKENGELFYQRFLLDSTAQKLQEKEKERLQAELVQALSIDYNIVWSFNLDTGIGMTLRYNNKDSCNLCKDNELAFDESIEHYIKCFVYEDDRNMLREILNCERLKKELTEKQLYYTNYRAVTDGEVQYYELKAVRTGSWQKNHYAVLGIRNVNDETRMEIEQKQMLENALLQANTANKAKSIFLSNMSHDIRTPMNAIMGFANLALMNIENREQVEDYLKKITASGNHLLSLINDVLDITQIESGKLQIEEGLCSLSDVIRNLKNIVHNHLQEKNLTLDIDMSDVADDEIYCDKLRLSQALLNILANSVKYTDDGGKITFTISEKKGSMHGFADYEFRITDNGIGMSKDFISHIYELFARERNTTNSGIQGTGLGMAITKNIVDIMKGSIDVKSVQGEGTEVTISLPLRLSSDDAANPTENPSAGENDSDNSENKSNRILLVEDNELNQEIAEAILTAHGFEVEIAENGEIAVNMLKKSAPNYYNIILMDIQMPVMNGYEATKAIRNLQDKNLSSISILAMTANAFNEDKQEALKCGMNGHIAKPIDIDKLISALNEILNK